MSGDSSTSAYQEMRVLRRVACLLRNVTLKSPVAAQGRLMILDRLTATERVASFLREMSERDDDEKHCDYLGITIEVSTHSIILLDLDRRRLKDVSVSG